MHLAINRIPLFQGNQPWKTQKNFYNYHESIEFKYKNAPSSNYLDKFQIIGFTNTQEVTNKQHF